MNYQKIVSIITYASFLFLLFLFALPLAQISNFFIDLPNWKTIMVILYSVISFIILLFGSNFSMFNAVEVWPKKEERIIAVIIAIAIWYLFFLYLFGPSVGNLSYSLAILIVISIFLFILSRNYSTKSIGIIIILPFSAATFIELFPYTFREVGSNYGYIYGIFMIIIELAVIIFLIGLRKRQWANYAISLLLVGTAIYGILLEGEYFSNYIFYVVSFVALLGSLIFTTLFYIKPTHMPFSHFFIFGKNVMPGKLLLVLVILLFIIGLYLVLPLSSIAPASSYVNYLLAIIFGGTIFYFLNLQSMTKVTDAVTFILIGGVAIYGLYYLIYVAPAMVIGGGNNKYALWFLLSFLIMYEPSFALTNYITENRINANFSITHLVDRWRRRSKLLHARYDISQTPFKETGGTANIYQAYDVLSGKDVIIKIPVILCSNCDFRGETILLGGKCPKCGTELNVQDFNEAIKILKDEINALSLLNSPNIVKQLDHFEEGNPVKTYLVEERVYGKSFSEMFDQKPIGEREMLDLIKQALHGINNAHMHGIIHRDLNTGNLMVTNSNEVKVIDFGTAKFKSRASMSRVKLSVGGKFGTEYFSPPESYYLGLIPNKEPTFSYDIYSLGCIMYFMLTGNRPEALDSTTARSIYPTNSYREDFVRDLSSQCSRQVLDIILKATSFFPEQRYQSAFEMICAIENIKGEFLVTSNEQAFSLPTQSNQPFSSEINLDFIKQAPSVAWSSFNSMKKMLNLELQYSYTKKQAAKYFLVLDSTLNQYKLIPKKSRLYFSYFDKNNKLITKTVPDTGIYLGREIILFSSTIKLTDVVLAYYKVR